MARKKNTILDDFEKEIREQGLTYRQAQIQETIALVKEGKLTKKAGNKRGRGSGKR